MIHRRLLSVTVILFILFLTACTSPGLSEITSDAVTILDETFSIAASFDPEPHGLGIQVTSSDPAVTFSLTADDGGLLPESSLEPVTALTRGSGESFGWVPYSSSDADDFWQGEATHINVQMQKEGKLIGYAVIRVTRDAQYQAKFSAQVLKCVTFADGQSASSSWVEKQMESLKSAAS